MWLKYKSSKWLKKGWKLKLRLSFYSCWSLTRVNSLLDGDESHWQSVLDVDQLHVHKDVA